MKPVKEDDRYIKLLRSAREDLMNSKLMTMEEFNKRVIDLGGVPTPLLYYQIYGPGAQSEIMSMDAYMSLLQFEEFVHSVEESSQARKEARWAIWVAIGMGLLQIILS